MKINVSEIPPEGLEIVLTKEAGIGSVKAVSPCHIALRLSKSGSEVNISGEVGCKVELQCSRCLNVFQYDIHSAVDVMFRPATQIDKEGCFELHKEDLDIAFYKNNILDIDDIANEQLALNIPMKPLCSAECRGICPDCGADMNKNQCECKGRNIDERFKVLERLIKKEV
jgi:uncharacterized protein